MEQHPIPRQITTFEFKLIGFMTLKQFLYLAISVPAGFIVFKALPIPIVNVVLGVLVGAIGAVFAFVPFQDRPIEDWVKNFIKRLNSPTQFFFHKEETSLSFLGDIYYESDPHLTLTHVDSREKLNAYLSARKVAIDPRELKKKSITSLLNQPAPAGASTISQNTVVAQSAPALNVIKQPFLTGIVKNRKQFALPGVLVSVVDSKGVRVRFLKSNPHGIFATYSALTPGDYSVEASDPNGTYFFDTIKLHVQQDQKPNLALISKEVA